MIIGLGSDIVQITRIEQAYVRFGAKFLNKIYTKYEQAQAQGMTDNRKIMSYYAKRFAAKEACVKAMGCGFRGKICFSDIEVSNDDLGKPLLKLYNEAAKMLNTLTVGKMVIHLSLSDDYPVAMAVVIISMIEK
jgi:holo-[acyl-carrier protein] synthase